MAGAPGVTVTTAVRSGPAGIPRAASGQFFVLGLAERGPVDEPAKINSMQDYRRILGERVTYGSLFDALNLFFEAGGAQAWVLRAVGPAATKGFVVLQDTAATPVPTARFEAANAGAWSEQVTVRVQAGTNGAGSRRIGLLIGGVVVEEYDNLSSVQAIINRFAQSPYVRVSDLGSPTAAPGNLPAVNGAGEPLSAGADDREAVTTNVLEAQLARFKPGLGDGSIAAPGYGETMHAPLIAHAKAHRRLALLSDTLGSDVTDLIAAATALQGTPGNEFAGLFAPWLLVADGLGGTRPVSPEAAVAAARNRAHETMGAWQPAAGELSITPAILGLEREFTYEDHVKLDAARVNPFRFIGGSVRLYGWNSLSSDDLSYGSLTVGDLLNRIVTEAERRLEPFVFRTIDGRGQLLPEVEGVLIGLLEPIAAAGGLYARLVGNEVADPGYTVNVGPNLNTVESLQNNILVAQIAARFSPNAEQIQLTVTKVGLAAAV